MSEFGLQSLPAATSMVRFLPTEQLFPPNAGWVYHHAQLDKLYRYAESVHPRLDTLEEFVEASQRAQALGIQTAVEHMRRRKGKTSGVSVWQFNDAWGAISWSIVDYYGVPKQAYSLLRTLYTPILVSFDCEWMRRQPGDNVHGDLWVVNDLLEEEEVEWRAVLGDLEVGKNKVRVAPNSAACVDVLDFSLGNGANVLRLEWSVGGQAYTLTYDLTWGDAGEMHPLFKLLHPLYEHLMR